MEFDSDTLFGFTIGAVIVICVTSVSSCAIITGAQKRDAAIAMQAAGANTLDIPCATGEATERYCELRAATVAAAGAAR